MKIITSLLLSLFTSFLIAQETSLVKNIPFTSIGPTIMSGRVVDLEVNPENPNEFYAAYASGGLWHTKNNGTTFTPILDTAKLKILELLQYIGKLELFGLVLEKIIHPVPLMQELVF